MEEGVTNQIVVEVARVFDKKTIVMPSQESCRHTFPIVKRGGIPALDKYLFHLGRLSQNQGGIEYSIPPCTERGTTRHIHL